MRPDITQIFNPKVYQAHKPPIPSCASWASAAVMLNLTQLTRIITFIIYMRSWQLRDNFTYTAHFLLAEVVIIWPYMKGNLQDLDFQQDCCLEATDIDIESILKPTTVFSRSVPIVGLRPALEGFVVTMHEGACETGSQIPTA